VKNASLCALLSSAQIAMTTSFALANPQQYLNVAPLSSVERVPIASHCDDIVCRSTKHIRPTNDPPATNRKTRMFVRRDCLEPAEGDAHFDALAAHRPSPQTRDELLPGEDCAPADDDDVED
jgi:hypothetical protein